MRCRHGHEHGSIVAAAACSTERSAPEPKRCDQNAGGCNRSELEGAVLRDGSALCEACKEAIAEVSAEDAEKLERVKRLVRATVRATKAANGMLGRRSEAPAFREEQKAAAALLADYLGHAPSAAQVAEVTE